jgi:hypothetical protein
VRLPNADEAVIPREKLRDYLLSPEHAVGRFKAAFFASLGYTREDWSALEVDLRSQHLPLDAEEVKATGYGRKFTITGPMRGPSSSTAIVTSVWVVRSGEETPRFVTAYPGGGG